ncbi:hypothetical protein NIES267_39870 [Calothrix parasitica NIES-267]|uniref:Uncharacterized protein n=1 Tax=Calothrix parasitica NIES-267 TaxID=1973488 RepID=A0A1Z4LTL1_9CYAN|nr:hypothetical protein NIES267_39870 [Calothrix parasitica NIES-267]
MFVSLNNLNTKLDLSEIIIKNNQDYELFTIPDLLNFDDDYNYF